jgi:lactoylglutathione lyase
MSINLVEGLSFRIHHTMLPVADLDRSIKFYTQLLGMDVRSRHANPARQTDVGLVGYGTTGLEPVLELTKDTSDVAKPVTPLNAHIAINVSDLHKLCSVLEQERVSFVRPFKARNDGKGFTAWISDPDGHSIELVEMHAV